MFSFMFGVLGSVFFWITFGILSVVMGSIVLKHVAPRTFEFILTGNKHVFLDYVDIFFSVLAVYLFWPIFIIVWLAKFIIINFTAKVFWPLFCKAVKFSVNIIPEISIKRK